MYLVDQTTDSQPASEHAAGQHQPSSETSGQGHPSDVASHTRKNPSNRVCRYFLRGNCRDGQNCRFKHVSRGETRDQTRDQDVEGNGAETSDAPKPATERKSYGQYNPRHCQFFMKGHCRHGQSCRFIHPYSLRTKLRREQEQSEARPVVPQTKAVLPNSRQEYPLEKVTSDVAQQLRRTELEQMKKRYPEGRYEGDECRVRFVPTDPDWPYDVKQLDMVVTLPETYPVDCMSFTVSEEQNLPPTLAEYLQKEISAWIERRHSALAADGKTQLIFRPLLIWLDRQLERLFTEGLTELKKELVAKQAGLEFVPAWKLRKRQTSTGASESETASGTGSETGSEIENATDDDETDSDVDEASEEMKEMRVADTKKGKSESVEPERKGTEIKLRQLQMQEQAGTLIADKLRLTVQCSRCKTDQDINLKAKRLSSLVCPKCHFVAFVNYRPSIMHQFSDVLGYLDVEGCSPVDLILADCEFAVGCANCNREMKKEHFQPGSVHDVRCHSCHSKLRIAAQSARFFQLQPGDALDIKKAQPIGGGRKKTKSEFQIRDGEPLPDEGTCKHYKKSFRWFRFPCCGKIYPCDVCHEEKKTDGHEMAWANRMICGHCSHEQAYCVDKPCRNCQHSMTKSSGSAYWEGGKGCRDKIKMNRNDSHKYQNVSKTVSKSTQKKSDQQKRTKPRHT